jgi:AraC-like DNA-binding protein
LTWVASPIALRNRLVSQATSIEELALADPSHLARPFRRPTGTTPHEFRA